MAAKKAAPTTVTLSSVYASYAAAKKIDTTNAAKRVRSRMRSNFTKVCELSPNVKQHKDEANDRKPWPKDVSTDLRDFILS